MTCSVSSRTFHSFGPVALAVALAFAVAGCQTVSPLETTGSAGVAAAPDGDADWRHGGGLGSGIGAPTRRTQRAAISHAHALRGNGQRSQAVAVLEQLDRAPREHEEQHERASRAGQQGDHPDRPTSTPTRSTPAPTSKSRSSNGRRRRRRLDRALGLPALVGKGLYSQRLEGYWIGHRHPGALPGRLLGHPRGEGEVRSGRDGRRPRPLRRRERDRRSQRRGRRRTFSTTTPTSDPTPRSGRRP